MTEDEARSWIRDRFGVSRETLLGRYAEILVAEAANQNLIAASTLESLWERHLVDSAQLLDHAGRARSGLWVDIGAGAGLPGIVLAILTDHQFALVEPRARRVAFLNEAVEALGIADRVTVVGTKIERFRPASPAAVVTARAVAYLPDLLAAARHVANSSTIWLLPKGRNAQTEVEDARRTWQGSFHVEPSITQPDSLIVIAREVRPR